MAHMFGVKYLGVPLLLEGVEYLGAGVKEIMGALIGEGDSSGQK